MLKNKKLIVILIFLSIFLLSISASSENILHVGKNSFKYYSIQKAINEAKTGDTIIVHNGTYNESIELYKKINLVGKQKVILEYTGSDDIIHISADNCIITGFTIQNSSNKSFSGINIESDGNTIKNNVIKNNKGNGLYLYHSKNDVICNNTFINDSICIVGYSSDWKSYTIKNNTVNDRPVLFYKNQKNVNITNMHPGQIILANCSFFNIRNNSFNNGDQGITIGFSDNNFISDNEISNNQVGLRLQYSEDNTIRNNTFQDNFYGLYITHSFNNLVFDNLFLKNNNYGCWICCNSKNNTLYRNKFLSNNKSAYDIFNNIWHKEGIGNHWDDYQGGDENDDGIGESPYHILPEYGSSKDPFPIVNYSKIKTDTDSDSSAESNSIPLVFIILLLITFCLIKKKNKYK
ncbi:MAG: NosD domain-containing protein [Candidatus Thermoplasmatota archaeon]